MRLLDLDARFLVDEAPDRWRYVDSIADARGVIFQCPKCAIGREQGEEEIDGVHRRFVRGAHYVLCWACGVPQDREPNPGRWRLVGTSIDDLTLAACPGKTRSVELRGGCCWHGHITQGNAE